MPLRSFRRFPLFRLLLAGLVGFLWWRSHWHTDVLAVFLNDGKAHVFASDRGRAVYLWTNLSFGPGRPYTYDWTHADNAEFDDTRRSIYETPPLPDKVAGVWLGSNSTDILNMPGSKYRMISAPFWQVAIVGGLPLALGLRTFWRCRRWGIPGCCAGCGYDIRFSTDRCPECGHEIPAPQDVK